MNVDCRAHLVVGSEVQRISLSSQTKKSRAFGSCAIPLLGASESLSRPRECLQRHIL